MSMSLIWFSAFAWAMAGSGIAMVRVFVVRRLRLLAGGSESRGLRAGKRAADVFVLFACALAAFWVVLAIALTLSAE
jgi:hypothetical protein